MKYENCRITKYMYTTLTEGADTKREKKNTLESSKGVHAQSDDCKLKGEKPDKNKIAFDCISHK